MNLHDVVDTAGTMVNAADALTRVGGAKAVYACATHGVLSGTAVESLNQSSIKEIVFLDTIPFPDEKRSGKFVSFSVAEIFAEAIDCIYREKPVSSLFAV